MPAATQHSVSEYLSTSYSPDREYVDGEIVERNLGEYPHSRTQCLLLRFLMDAEKRWGTLTLISQRVRVSSNRYRVPDLCVLLTNAPDEEIITNPPFLCVEILSKDDLMSRTQEKIEDYLEMGVPHVWVIDPRTRRGYHYTSDGMREAKDGILRTSSPDIAVPIAELFD